MISKLPWASFWTLQTIIVNWAVLCFILFSEVVAFASSGRINLKDRMCWIFKQLSIFLGLEARLAEDAFRMYDIPVFVRKDGFVIRLGGVVESLTSDRRSTGLYGVKTIQIRSDGLEVIACIVLLSGPNYEESFVSIDKLHPADVRIGEFGEYQAKATKHSAMMALNISRVMSKYPDHIHRRIRRHQLATQTRSMVKKFLLGMDRTIYFHLGPINWLYDPGILGVEDDFDFKVTYEIEKYKDQHSHLDVMFGERWDLCYRPELDQFRAILTFELSFHHNQSIRCKVDTGEWVQGKPLPGINYRCQYLSMMAGATGRTIGGAPSLLRTIEETTFDQPSQSMDFEWDELFIPRRANSAVAGPSSSYINGNAFERLNLTGLTPTATDVKNLYTHVRGFKHSTPSLSSDSDPAGSKNSSSAKTTSSSNNTADVADVTTVERGRRRRSRSGRGDGQTGEEESYFHQVAPETSGADTTPPLANSSFLETTTETAGEPEAVGEQEQAQGFQATAEELERIVEENAQRIFKDVQKELKRRFSIGEEENQEDCQVESEQGSKESEKRSAELEESKETAVKEGQCNENEKEGQSEGVKECQTNESEFQS